jgi:hypothetical protein
MPWRRARRDVDANANARVALCLVLSIETIHVVRAR